MLFRFIGFYYLKYFFIVFLGLEGFFVAAEVLRYADDLPNSANLLILFLFYDAIWALTYTLPISLVLGSILFYMTFLKSLQLTALMALGYSKLKILLPIATIASIFTIASILLNATPFAYAQEQSEAIIYQHKATKARENILLKSNDSYIFIRKLYTILNKQAQAEGIKIFTLDSNRQLKTYYEAQSAVFESNAWHLKDVSQLDINGNLALGQKALTINKLANLEILKGFNSKVLETISKDRPTASITDAFNSLKIAINQKVNSDKIRSILYGLVLVPFFVPLCIAIIAFYIPSLPRYENLTLISFTSIVAALAIWGMFYSLSKLSVAGIVYPEFAILLPFVILFVIFIWHIKHFNQKFS